MQTRVCVNGKESKMTLVVGDKVVYPSQGPCLIEAVVQKVIDGRPTSFYRFAILDGGGELFVPLDKVATLRLRQLMAKSEIPKLLGHLEKFSVVEKNWRQRDVDNARLLSSGSTFDLAEIVESLTDLSATKSLRPHDRQILERAKKILVCEIAEATGTTIDAASERVDEALKMRKQA
jgi:RNA polymerase-interacting CarD/CdnL/TRCF family regulator